eukprot:236128-Chlamydomonas_euryale.AAC.1
METSQGNPDHCPLWQTERQPTGGGCIGAIVAMQAKPPARVRTSHVLQTHTISHSSLRPKPRVDEPDGATQCWQHQRVED